MERDVAVAGVKGRTPHVKRTRIREKHVKSKNTTL
jgi:hypothetical protein